MDEKSEPNCEGDVRDTALRTVTIHRSGKGYGLIVSGESPVIVQDVRDGGPAAQAGVKKGDSIIMVNNTLVSMVNHKNVVDIIKSAQCVKLTLQSGGADQVVGNGPPKSYQQSGMKSAKNEITAPLPVDMKLKKIMGQSKLAMLEKYLDRQTRVRDNMIIEIQKTTSPSLQHTMEERLKTLELSLHKMEEEYRHAKENPTPDMDLDCESSQPLTNVNRTPSHPHAFHPYQQHTRSVSDVPPPLPARNRFHTQLSAPHVPLSNSKSTSANLSSCAAPPLPPRPPHMERLADNGQAQSLENIAKLSNLSYSNSSGSESSHHLTHHRVKSSPDPLGRQDDQAPNRNSITESIEEGSICSNRFSVAASEDEPPGTPPPPYLNNPLQLNCDEAANHNYCTIPDELCSSSTPRFENINSSILTMEDEDGDMPVDDHGPFKNLQLLMSGENNAYLAVFINYVISNCDPSSLFFYTISEMYKLGGAKEMKKWAYELHSCFLLPGAPMRLPSADDESLLNEIDEDLQTDYGTDKEMILRKVFYKVRLKARDDLNEQLADFRSKRSAGLGSLFGPSDAILEESLQNKPKEQQIIEDLLVPCLDSVSEDLKNQTDMMLIMASSLATLLSKWFCAKSPHAQQLIDKCPLFVSKDRPLRSKLLKSSKKHVVREHTFNLASYVAVTNCNHCGLIIWGFSPQGYQCGNCEMNIHKSCVKSVEEICVGQMHRNEKAKDTKFSKFLLRIVPDERERTRKQSQVSATQIEKARRGYEDGDILGPYIDNESTGDKIGGSSGVSREQRKSDAGNGTSSLLNNGGLLDEEPNAHPDDTDQAQSDQPSPLPSTDAPPNNLGKSHGGQKKKSASSINRSESCKEKQHSRKQARENRKNSDPNIPTSKSGDVDGENPLNFQSGSSSNSSLSQSQESPGNSAEVQAYASVLDNDSDIEAEADLPEWKNRLSPEELQNLSSKDRKRQETINELFHTEQSHVRTLKVLQSLFYQPLRQSTYLSTDLLERLFPNLDQMLRFHSGFNKAMKKRRQESTVIQNIGDILINMFEGEEGQQFQQAAAEFVSYQSSALEDLKVRQKRDHKLALFLQDQENHHHCRRLQLKDMLPAIFQRLTKYPLLLESLLSYTSEAKDPEEHQRISTAVERSREILAYVNAAVQDADNHRRLIEIQKKLDQSSLAKNKHGNCDELRGELDLRKHHLLYDGHLTWRNRNQKNIDLYVLVLEDCLVLLQKDNDKYVLKYHNCNKAGGKDEKMLNHSPIIKFGTFIVRPVATDNRSFFIVVTQSSLGAQIYEMCAVSVKERKIWIKQLSEAQDNLQQKLTGVPFTNAEDEVAITEQFRDEDDNADSPQNDQLEVESQKDPTTPDPAVESTLPPEGTTKKTELLRRKDLKIRQELEEKQNLIADILNIPREHFESVADMATEVGLASKEPRELVLGAIFQAKKLQETLNEAQTIKETDVISAQATGDRSSKGAESLPLYPAPMERLLTISGSLTELLNSLLTLVSERDDERERMRKELVASRDRIHQMHMHSTKADTTDSTTEASDSLSCKAPPARFSSVDASTPHSSRPNSYISIGSSGTDTVEPLVEQPKDEDIVIDSVDAAQDKNCDAASTIEEEEADTETVSLKEDVEAS